MTPLLKYLLKKRVRNRVKGASINELNNHIEKIIRQNKQRLVDSGSMGGRLWWKEVNKLSNRKQVCRPFLKEEAVNDLNDYFANLCSDDSYVNPNNLIISANDSVPQLDELQVLNTLLRVQETATGPDGIPYWVWRDFGDLLAPVVLKCWNLSLSTHTWPSLWKLANINPLPKVDTPLTNSDFRGINVTSVIARLFEKTVYRTFCIDKFEKHLNETQVRV